MAGSQGAPRRRSWTENRPTHPTFLREEAQEIGEDDLPDDFQDDLRAATAEWQALPPHVRELLNFDRYLNQRREHMRSSRQNRRFRGGHDSELQRAVSKLTLPSFNGSGQMTAQAWVHMLDTFLALRPMSEIDAIRYATLHLEGAAHDW